MLDFIKNNFLLGNKYKTNSEAIIISCYFNPQNSPYRLQAFLQFYDSIKHLNHKIIECVIGDSTPQLDENENIERLYTPNLLWHKESLLNKIISELPSKYKYIFWVDADVMFSNKNWLVDGVKQLKTANIIQPFEYCVHLDKGQKENEIDIPYWKNFVTDPQHRHKKLWRSFCANYVESPELSANENYDVHGHVGFAWGARREVLDMVPLYDKALIGGGDHIIAHAAAGQIPHKCITKSFTDNIDEVLDWSRKFFSVVKGEIGYVPGNLYHIWHGHIENRQYLKRIQEFTVKTKQITQKDKNGLFMTNNEDDSYVRNYFNQREREDILNPTNILTDPLNPLNPLNPFSPFNILDSDDDGYINNDVDILQNVVESDVIFEANQDMQDSTSFDQEYENFS